MAHRKKTQARSKKKSTHGVLLLDKPLGMTSNAALQKVKWLYQAKKAGHTGSLDPLATGLLPICFGQATKVSEYLLGSSKRYTTVIKLGEVTDTLDAEGEVTHRSDVDVSDDQLQRALAQFRGEIKQIPPMFSALKKDGQPLYKLARKGEEIERAARDMTVHELSAVRISDRLVSLKVHCSSGFYIRSLAHDLGQALGCGAHVVELRRTDIKTISVNDAHTLDALLELGEDSPDLSELLLPIDTLIEDMPSIVINEKQADGLIKGQKTRAGDLVTKEISRFYRDSGEFFAIGEVDEAGLLKTHKIFVDIA